MGDLQLKLSYNRRVKQGCFSSLGPVKEHEKLLAWDRTVWTSLLHRDAGSQRQLNGKKHTQNFGLSQANMQVGRNNNFRSPYT